MTQQLHTVEGLNHSADFVAYDGGVGFMRVEPPVEFSDEELDEIKANSGFDTFEMMATSFGSEDRPGGTLFCMVISEDDPKEDYEARVAEGGRAAAEILLARADAAASREGLKALYKID